MAEHRYDEYGLSTKAIHAGLKHDEYGSASPAIYQTSTFRFEDCAQGAARFAGKEAGYIYTRIRNPTNKMMEDCVASLEGGYGCFSCSSGMAASNTVFMTLLEAGAHVVCSESVYGPIRGVLSGMFKKFGVEADFVDTSNLEAIEAAMKPNTKIVYIESPCNPTLTVSDVEAVGKIAHAHNAKFVVDNTFMSPILQNPIALGADIVVHSITKFINGHSDVVGGVIVCASEEQYNEMKKPWATVGGTMDPHQAWLVYRGIRTLKLRVLAAQANAIRVAELLEASDKVERVLYPGLKSFPYYETHAKQARGPGSLISFEMKGGMEAAGKLLANLKLYTLAVSLGGVETLIQHPAGMTHSGMPREDRIKAGISDGLIRLSVGCEEGDDLVKDMEQSLATC